MYSAATLGRSSVLTVSAAWGEKEKEIEKKEKEKDKKKEKEMEKEMEWEKQIKKEMEKEKENLLIHPSGILWPFLLQHLPRLV
jgi:hypothetical protein